LSRNLQTAIKSVETHLNSISRSDAIRAIKAAVMRHRTVYGVIPGRVYVSREIGWHLLDQMHPTETHFMVNGIACEVDKTLRGLQAMTVKPA